MVGGDRSIRRARGIGLAVVILGATLAGLSPAAPADEPGASYVLVVVPPGSELGTVERIRSAVTARHRALVVGEADRVAVKGGFEMLVDRSFATAPAASVLVLVPGEPGRAEETFLLDRRRSAKAILLPGGSPLAERLRGDGAAGSALILLGGPESIATMLDALDALDGAGGSRPAAVAAPPPAPEPTRAVRPASVAPAPPERTPTPAVSARVFDRYFSSRSPTPTRTPR